MSIEFSLEITGFDELLAAVGKQELRNLHQGGEALVALGRKIAEVIRDHYVPVNVGMKGVTGTVGQSPITVRLSKTLQRAGKAARGGTLRASVGSSSTYRILGSEAVEVTVYAGRDGSGAERYAAVQHEVLWYKHVIGQAKYVEIPVMLIAPQEMAPEIVKHVRMGMGDFLGGKLV